MRFTERTKILQNTHFQKWLSDFFFFFWDHERRPVQTGCSHSGSRFPKQSQTKRLALMVTNNKLEKMFWMVLQIMEMGSYGSANICLFWEHACARRGIGAEKCSIGGLSFQFCPSSWHPAAQSTQIFNEDQIVLQRAQLDPVFVANAREVMKSRHQRPHASLQQTFPRKVDQFLFGGRALITRVWDLKKTDFVQLNARPPHPHPGSGRSKRVVWRKSDFFQVGTCASASLPPRSWSQYISTRSTSSCHICHKVSPKLKWIVWL